MSDSDGQKNASKASQRTRDRFFGDKRQKRITLVERQNQLLFRLLKTYKLFAMVSVSIVTDWSTTCEKANLEVLRVPSDYISCSLAVVARISKNETRVWDVVTDKKGVVFVGI